MLNEFNLELYEGTGRRITDREMTLPAYEAYSGLEDPGNYIADSGLRDAVNVALALGQPLLVTGEPGTGKTCLAASIAWELGLELLTFHTKTTSTAADLFYHYDALRRFQDAQLGERKDIADYITCQALGSAILLANPTPRARAILADNLKDKGPVRSVVLIDEIDKAPRDLPNDVLNEVEKMTFKIKETTWEAFEIDPKNRPILVLTSNSEKNLPDAFLRRCIFYHIEFPDAKALKRIVMRRFEGHPDITPDFKKAFLDGATGYFEEIRKIGLKKPPATAEFLSWICILKSMDVDMRELRPEQADKLSLSYSVLAKNHEDLERLKKNLLQRFS